MIAEYEHLGSSGADLTEMRLDFIGRSIDLRRLLAKRHTPVLITCRRREDGGRWDRSEEERLMILRTAIATGVDFVDLEEDIAGDIPRYGSTKRIVSMHNFEHTPENLEEIHARLAQQDADIVKIATMANSFADCVRMMQLVESARIPTIGLCMGEIGMLTRILALRLGSPLTYCAMSSERKLPGQIPSIRCDLYRVKQIDRETNFWRGGRPGGSLAQPPDSQYGLCPSRLERLLLAVPHSSQELRAFMNWCREVSDGLERDHSSQGSHDSVVDEAEARRSRLGALNTVVLRTTRRWPTTRTIERPWRSPGGLATRAQSNGPKDATKISRGRSVLLLGAGGVAGPLAMECGSGAVW